MYRYVSILILGMLLLGLQGCGFHWRGQDPQAALPFDTLYLDTSTPYSVFSKALREQLQALKVNMPVSPEQAPLSLRILGDTQASRDLSVSGNGQTRRMVLTEEVTYELHDQQGHIIGQKQTVQAQRYLTQTQDQILAGSNDQLRLQEEMAKACARQVILQLQSPEVKESLNKQRKAPKGKNAH